MLKFAMISVLVATALAGTLKHNIHGAEHYPKQKVKAKDNYVHHNYGPRVYRGRYSGACESDGFYLRDSHSFVICSNSNAYVQPCAPGSANSGYNHYHKGQKYAATDFCDINLVDNGYGAHYKYGYHGYGYPYNYHGAYPYVNFHPGYGFPYNYYGFPYNYHYGKHPAPKAKKDLY